MVGKVVSILSAVLTVPITLHYLGDDRYGVWMSASSILAFFAFADLGLGNGLQNALSRAAACDDRESAARDLSCTFYTLFAVAACLLVVSLTIASQVNWAGVLNASTSLGKAEAWPTLATALVITCLGIPLSLGLRIQFAYQEGTLASAVILVGAVLGVIATVIAARAGASLPVLMASASGAALIVNASVTFLELFIRRPWLRPRLTYVGKERARALLGTGAVFLALQFFNSINHWSDNIIIAHHEGSAAVAPYSAIYRLYFSAIIFNYVGQGLLPAYVEANARGDFLWVRRTFYRSLCLSALFGLGSALSLLAAGPWLLTHWIGAGYVPTWQSFAGFGVWITWNNVGSAMHSFFNSGVLLRTHATLYCVACVLSIGGMNLFLPLGGIPAMILANALCFCVIYMAPMLFIVRRHFVTVMVTE